MNVIFYVAIPTEIPPQLLPADRRRQTGCKLDIRSSGGSGTEIDLSVPGPMAYSKPATVPFATVPQKGGMKA